MKACQTQSLLKNLMESLRAIEEAQRNIQCPCQSRIKYVTKKCAPRSHYVSSAIGRSWGHARARVMNGHTEANFEDKNNSEKVYFKI